MNNNQINNVQPINQVPPVQTPPVQSQALNQATNVSQVGVQGQQPVIPKPV